MNELSIEQREKLILDYLYHEGYTNSKSIAAFLKEFSSRGTSLENIRKSLQKFYQEKLIEYKQLENNEKVYFLTESGLKGLEKSSQEISEFKKCLNSIDLRHIHHYWFVCRLEKSLLKNIKDTGKYLAESMNEFNASSLLHVKLQERWKHIQLRSDAEIKILRDGQERLVLKVEIDTGVESISRQIREKLDNYYLYLQSTQINQQYHTYPIYVLFITPAVRINNIFSKLGRHEAMPFMLFMPLELLQTHSIDVKFQQSLDQEKNNAEFRRQIKDLGFEISQVAKIQTKEKGEKWLIDDPEKQFVYLIEQEKKHLTLHSITDLFYAPVMKNGREKAVSLSSILEGREQLLCFYNAVCTAASRQQYYHMTVHTMFSLPGQPFFPMLIGVGNYHVLWQPHGYIILRKPVTTGQFQDILFALILCLKNFDKEICREDLLPYENFLGKEIYLSKLIHLPVYSGCFIIAQDQDQVEKIKKLLDGLAMKERTRIILHADCVQEKVLSAPVWQTITGTFLSLLKRT